MQRKVLYGLLLIALLAVPVLGIYPLFVMKVMCFALFAAAFNLLIGYTGLLSFGHAMFLASAGYTTGYAIQTLGLSPELGVLAGTAAATMLGLVVGRGAVFRRACGDGAGVPADRAHRAFAVRTGAGGDQGERAARGVARL